MVSHGRWMVSVSLAFLIFGLFLGSGAAELLTVCKDGCDFSSLCEAVDSANPGDVLEVDSGVYKENPRIRKSLTLLGKNTGFGRPVIDAGFNGSAVYILANRVTLEGFNLTNASGSRLDLYAGVRVLANDSILRGISAFNNENGILLTCSLNSTLESNHLQENTYGIRIEGSRNITIAKNTMQNNRYGLQLISSHGNLLSSNLAEKNEFGIQLNNSENNTLIGNQMRGNSYNFGAEGYNDVAIDNLVDSRPIIYLLGTRDKIIDSSTEVGTVYCLDCLNITIRGINLSHTFYGIYLSNTTGSTVEYNDVKDGCIGISLIDSNDNLLRENRVERSLADGLNLIDSDGNVVHSNALKENRQGLYLLRSGYNQIQGNNFIGGEIGAFLEASWRNRVQGNTISGNDYGLVLLSSVINNISKNNITNNNVGLLHEGTGNNTLDNRISNNIVPEKLFEKRTAESGPRPGAISVDIKSEPPGADVLIGGVPMKWQTPGCGNFPGPGSYDIELRLNDKKITRKLIIPEDIEPEPISVDFNEAND